MFKHKFAIIKTAIALPLHIAWDFQKTHWQIGVQVLIFSFALGYIRMKKTTVIEVPPTPVTAEPEQVSPTKAYADQRQKAKRNRKRKPSKAMRNLYQLEG